MTAAGTADFIGLGLALAAGLLIGLERGWHQREMPDGHRVAGLRTFALVSLAGGATALLAERWGVAMPVAAFAGVCLLALAGYAATVVRRGTLGLTTAVALPLTFVIGALAGEGEHRLAAALAVVTVALLKFKQPLHAGLGRLSELEVNSGVQLLLISVVVLPVLPDRGFGPYEALNPYLLWWAVVLLALLSFAGFVMMRWLGTGRGLTAAALLGGLVSSTATSVTLARWSRETPALQPLAAAGATLACATMFARMAVLIAVTAPALAGRAVAVLAAMALSGALIGTVMARRARADGLPEHLGLSNPLDLLNAVRFAALLAVVLPASRWLAERHGDAGLLATAAAAGLVDVDAITLSVGRMLSESVVTPAAGLGAIVAAASVNQVAKLGLMGALGRPSLAVRMLPPYLAMAGVGGLAMFFVRTG